MEDRLKAAEKIIDECFWGDYKMNARDLIVKLDNDEPGFSQFLFSKIIENSRFPSKWLKVIFPQDQLERLLNRYTEKNKERRRIRLISANLTGNVDLVPEYQWKK